MSQRLNEYLTQETVEYLSQLEALLASPGTPDLEQLLRLARGVCGSAQMAGAETLAGVAERLEDAVRSVVSRHVVWSEEIRQLSAQTVRDLQILVRALNRWGPEEEARVRAAVERWDDLEHAGELGRVVPIASLFYDDEGPHVLPSPADGATDAPVVPIQALLLRGEPALREALSLRPEVERALRSHGLPDAVLREALGELFELLELALPGEASAA